MFIQFEYFTNLLTVVFRSIYRHSQFSPTGHPQRLHYDMFKHLIFHQTVGFYLLVTIRERLCSLGKYAWIKFKNSARLIPVSLLHTFFFSGSPTGRMGARETVFIFLSFNFYIFFKHYASFFTQYQYQSSEIYNPINMASMLKKYIFARTVKKCKMKASEHIFVGKELFLFSNNMLLLFSILIWHMVYSRLNHFTDSWSADSRQRFLL